MEIGRYDFNRFKSGSAKIFGHPAGAALDVGLVLGLGANARDFEKFAEFRQILVAATFDKFSKVHKRPSGT